MARMPEQRSFCFLNEKEYVLYERKILVLSDSHGNVNNMVTAVSRLHPDMIIHLGDCWADAEQLHRKFPMTIMEQDAGKL